MNAIKITGIILFEIVKWIVLFTLGVLVLFARFVHRKTENV